MKWAVGNVAKPMCSILTLLDWTTMHFKGFAQQKPKYGPFPKNR